LFENEKFPEDSFDSDEYMVRKLFLKSNKIAFCKSIFYYRQDNEQAITKSFSSRKYYSILRDFKIYRLLFDANFDTKIIVSNLLEIYKLYINLYRLHLNRKAISSNVVYEEIHVMLVNLYVRLKREKRNQRSHGIKNYFLIFLFNNFFVFKCFMFFVHKIDSLKKELRKIKHKHFNG
jgi:hypothetical protein